MVLSQEDKHILKGIGQYSGSSSQLNDNHIFEFNKILKTYTKFDMQCTINMRRLSNIKPVDINNDFIQLLFSGSSENGHWICIWYTNFVIHVFDSLNKHSLDNDHIIVLNRMFPNKGNISIIFENVQNQKNPYDCGVLSIAFAVAIVFQQSPCTVQFVINEMQKHLYKMYETYDLLPFPISAKNFECMQHNNRVFQLTSIFSHVNIDQLEAEYIKRLIKEQQVLMQRYRSTKQHNFTLTDHTSFSQVDAEYRTLHV